VVWSRRYFGAVAVLPSNSFVASAAMPTLFILTLVRGQGAPQLLLV